MRQPTHLQGANNTNTTQRMAQWMQAHLTLFITLMLSIVLGMSAGAQAEEIILDNGTAAFSATGTWPTSTSVAGHEGNNYQYHSPSAAGSTPNGTLIDNTDAGFSVTGTWPNSTSIAGYNGSNYQYHASNSGAAANAITIDNLDSNNTSAGSWNNSTSAPGYNGSNYQYNAAGTGADTFTWAPTIASSTQYDVYAKWTAHNNRASNAKYTINHSTGADTITVNQKTNGGTWQLLGTYTLTTGSTITLSDDADGYVIADGIQLLPAGETPAPPVANTATWNTTLATAGGYEVYARWAAHPNRATDAAYTINHSTGSNTVTANQQSNGGSWQLLGTYSFNAGAASVSLSDVADGYVIADSVIFSPVGSGTNNNSNTATWTPTLSATAEYEVYAKWTAHNNRASNASYTINHTNGSNTVTVNQKQDGGAWNLLGTYTLTTGNTISLTDQADGYVVADGIRLVSTAATGPAQVYYIHTDHLNTPRVIEDQNQNTVWEWDNDDPFANNAPDADPNNTGTDFTYNHRFPGQYYDKETNNHYNYFRDYDPVTGRYIQSDPIGLRGGINTYGYVGGSPVMYSDPFGLSYENSYRGADSVKQCGVIYNRIKGDIALESSEQIGECFEDGVKKGSAMCAVVDTANTATKLWLNKKAYERCIVRNTSCPASSNKSSEFYR